MKPEVLLGIYRERIFSPGKIEDDAAIMDATLEELSRRGWKVRSMHADSISSSFSRPSNALSMAQSGRVLNILEDWSKQGTRVMNTVASVLNCYRKPLIHLLSTAGVCIPSSRIVGTRDAEAEFSLQPGDGFWLKRGDVHAIEPGDVARVTCREELEKALEHFLDKNIRNILVQEHVRGPVVKFYGVGQRRYFKAYMAASGEELTSEAERLRDLAQKAASIVGLEVYGGDAVMTQRNGPVLIDLNDWPSFSRCCHSAAMSIAAHVGTRFQLWQDQQDGHDEQNKKNYIL
jgi:glutathione synthase/RimK-type ligase-like ATP-grasp enzyme